MAKISVLDLRLFKHSYDSFLAALDAEDIPHGAVHQFSLEPQGSAFQESISAFSDVMPWKSIAKVIVAWIEARKSREIIITTMDQRVIHLKGYSVSDAEKIIKTATQLAVIDTEPN